MEIITHSNNETQELGRRLGERAFSSMIVALKGEVGAGKTEFVKGFTNGANSDNATSPTFAIMNVYEGGKLPIYHFDFYRCGGDYEEFEEYIFGDGVSLIEWSEYLDLPKALLTVEIIKLGDDDRKILFVPGDHRYKQLIKEAYSDYIGN